MPEYARESRRNSLVLSQNVEFPCMHVWWEVIEEDVRVCVCVCACGGGIFVWLVEGATWSPMVSCSAFARQYGDHSLGTGGQEYSFSWENGRASDRVMGLKYRYSSYMNPCILSNLYTKSRAWATYWLHICMLRHMCIHIICLVLWPSPDMITAL